MSFSFDAVLHDFRCEKCGSRKLLFFAKRPALQIGCLAAFVGAASFPLLQRDGPVGVLAGAAVALVSVLVVLTTLRIRCLDCEPRWLADRW